MSTSSLPEHRNNERQLRLDANPARPLKIVAMLTVASALIIFSSPPTALVSGIVFALLVGHPFARHNHSVTKWLLQICVVLLGFGMDLPKVLRLGLNGSVFAAVTIVSTFALGAWLGRRFSLNKKTTALISSGTAICGGSAIAAVSSVIGASETEVAVSIGTVFLLNAVALYIFPIAGHLLHLSEGQFGLWAGVAIHDVSSVVGAGLSYGNEALQTATAVKLARTLWIIPVTLVLALRFGRSKAGEGNDTNMPQGHHHKVKVTIPWFIGFFLAASLCRSYIPAYAPLWPGMTEVARRGMVIVLFLIGSSLSLRALRSVGWRTVAVGMILWVFVSTSSLISIKLLNLEI